MDESCSIQTLPFSCIKMRNRYQNLLRNKSLIFGGHLTFGFVPFCKFTYKKWENICKKNEEYGMVRMYMCEMFKRKGG